MKVLDDLFELQDKKYAEFHSRLVPTLPKEAFIGVRVPDARKLAKRYIKEDEAKIFMCELPHKYYDENLLHGLMISEIEDYDLCIKELELFLPYVDNWAVCDTISPKIFKKYRVELFHKIEEWAASKHIYTCRFGLEMLMTYFLDDDFKSEYLEIPASIRSEEYYVNMMIAWFFATALAKQWESAVPYLKNHRLDTWVHDKTIRKACESYRISDERKQILKSLK